MALRTSAVTIRCSNGGPLLRSTLHKRGTRIPAGWHSHTSQSAASAQLQLAQLYREARRCGHRRGACRGTPGRRTRMPGERGHAMHARSRLAVTPVSVAVQIERHAHVHLHDLCCCLLASRTLYLQARVEVLHVLQGRRLAAQVRSCLGQCS